MPPKQASTIWSPTTTKVKQSKEELLWISVPLIAAGATKLVLIKVYQNIPLFKM